MLFWLSLVGNGLHISKKKGKHHILNPSHSQEIKFSISIQFCHEKHSSVLLTIELELPTCWI